MIPISHFYRILFNIIFYYLCVREGGLERDFENILHIKVIDFVTHQNFRPFLLDVIMISKIF